MDVMLEVLRAKTPRLLVIAVTLLCGIEQAAAGVIFSESAPGPDTGCVAVNEPGHSATGVHFCVDPVVPDEDEVFLERGTSASQSKWFSDLVLVFDHGVPALDNPTASPSFHGPMISETVAVDEPAALTLLGIGLFAVGLVNRRRRAPGGHP